MVIVVKVCKFPCSSTTKLLIAAGADPQVIHLITPFYTSEWNFTKMILKFFPQCLMVEEQFTNRIFSGRGQSQEHPVTCNCSL